VVVGENAGTLASRAMVYESVLDLPAWADVQDEEIVERIRAGETVLYEILMRRHNQRLYRVAVSILRNDSEAEDVMQEAYVRAYTHLNQFAGDAKFSTWLTKIAVHEALSRLRERGRTEDLDLILETNIHVMANAQKTTRDPEKQAYGEELRVVMERAISALPDTYRSVFVLRAIEGLNVAETAACLELSLETVKTRFHRGRSLLRQELQREAGVTAAQAFPFHLSRCDRIVEAVFKRINGDGQARFS
jgi:RNA polymerase sigma-70 factor, ECF subfamily